MPEKKQTYAEKMAEWDDENLRSILKFKYGREYIWGLLKKCGINQLGVSFESPYATYFNAGMRNIGNIILDQVTRLDPEAYLLMMKAARQEEKYAKQAADKEIKEKENEDNV